MGSECFQWLRTCLAKREASLQKSMEPFQSATDLTAVQSRLLDRVCVCHLAHLPFVMFLAFVAESWEHFFGRIKQETLELLPRILQKMNEVMTRLQEVSGNLDGMYTNGIVEGFSEEWWP